MELKNIIKRASALALFLAVSFSGAMAEESEETIFNVSIDRTFIAASERVTVYVNMENNRDVSTITGHIVLPEGFSFVDIATPEGGSATGSYKKCEMTDRCPSGTDIQLTSYKGDEHDAFFCLSGLSVIKGTEGPLFSFTVEAGKDINPVSKIKIYDVVGARYTDRYTCTGGSYELIDENYKVDVSIEDFAIAPEGKVNTALNITNDKDMSDINLDIVLPEGLTLDTESVKAAERLGTGYDVFVWTLPNNVYRFLVTHNSGSQFSGNGPLFTFDVTADETFAADAVIEIKAIDGCDLDEIPYYGADATTNVKFDTSSGITSVEGADGTGAKAIYNVNGVRTDRLTKGVNIIRRADGSTIKVIKK